MECQSLYLMLNFSQLKLPCSSIPIKRHLGFTIDGWWKEFYQWLCSYTEFRITNIHWFLMREFAILVIWWNFRRNLQLWQQNRYQMFGYFILMVWALCYLLKRTNWFKLKEFKNTSLPGKTQASKKFEKFTILKNCLFFKF